MNQALLRYDFNVPQPCRKNWTNLKKLLNDNGKKSSKDKPRDLSSGVGYIRPKTQSSKYWQNCWQMLTKLVSRCRQTNELISWKLNRFFEELHKIFFQSTTSWFVFKSLSFFSIEKRKVFVLSSKVLRPTWAKSN